MSTATFDRVLEKLRTTVRGQRLTTSRSRFGTSDIVQESAIQVWQQAANEKVPLEQLNTAWLKTIAFGHFCKLHRFHLAAKRSTKTETADSRSMSQNCPTPVEEASEKEDAIRLLNAIEKLDYLEAQIVIGKFYQDKSISEIARDLETPRYQIERTYLKALRQLESFLGD